MPFMRLTASLPRRECIAMSDREGLTPSQERVLDQAIRLAQRAPEIFLDEGFATFRFPAAEWFRKRVMLFVSKRGKVRSLFVDNTETKNPSQSRWQASVKTYAGP